MRTNTFVCTLRLTGLTGEYTSQVEVTAKDASSASNKARKHIGNRDGYVASVVPKTYPEKENGE